MSKFKYKPILDLSIISHPCYDSGHNRSLFTKDPYEEYLLHVED